MQDTTPVAPGPRAGRREWTGLAVLALPAFVIALDFSVLNLAVPVISRELIPTGTELLWIVDIYGFILAGFLVTMARAMKPLRQAEAVARAAADPLGVQAPEPGPLVIAAKAGCG